MRRNRERDAKRDDAVKARENQLIRRSSRPFPEWMSDKSLLPKQPPSKPKLPDDPT